MKNNVGLQNLKIKHKAIITKKSYNMKQKKIITTCAAIVMIVDVAFSVQSFAIAESTTVKSALKTKTFIKTKNKCTKSNCSCSGYWGYKHQNGTYEGNCSNTDKYGHKCGHGPEKHGLKKW